MKLSMREMHWVLAAAVIICSGATWLPTPNKVLHVASFDIETLDPQQFNDNPSFEVLVSIFEPLYEVDYLAVAADVVAGHRGGSDRGYRRRQDLDDARQAGDLLHRRPRFQGQAARAHGARTTSIPIKRWLDPNGRRGGQPIVTDLVVGARAVVDAAKKTGKFDFDTPDRGLARARSIYAAVAPCGCRLRQRPRHDCF